MNPEDAVTTVIIALLAFLLVLGVRWLLRATEDGHG